MHMADRKHSINVSDQCHVFLAFTDHDSWSFKMDKRREVIRGESCFLASHQFLSSENIYWLCIRHSLDLGDQNREAYSLRNCGGMETEDCTEGVKPSGKCMGGGGGRCFCGNRQQGLSQPAWEWALKSFSEKEHGVWRLSKHSQQRHSSYKDSGERRQVLSGIARVYGRVARDTFIQHQDRKVHF